MLGGDRRIIIILVQLLFFLGVPSVVDGAIVFEESQSGTALSTDTVTSATITGVNDHLYLAAIGARSAHTVSSVSGLGLTWTEVAAQCAARETTSGISIWKAQGTVSGDDTVTATLDSNSNTLVLVVARYSGVNTTNAVGNFDSANTFGVDGACSGGTDSTGYSFGTMDTSQDNSMVFVAVNPRLTSPSPGSGYTERDEAVAGSGGDTIRVAINDKPFATTTTDLTVDGTISTARDWAVLAIEIMDASATAVELTSLDAVQQRDGVLLRWRTGWEVDNLGFRVHREQHGQLLQVTSSIVAGSGLLTGRTSMMGRSYGIWDALPAAAGEIQYWLEAVDLDGTSSWHGPVVPRTDRIAFAEQLPSASLMSLGQGPQTHGVPTARPANRVSTKTTFMDAVATSEEPISERFIEGTAENLQIQRAIAGRPAVKLLVRREGWYRVSQPELEAAGLDRGIEPVRLQLFEGGQEQPMIVQGWNDGRLDAWDSIEFYGRAQDTQWSNTRTYWLVGGEQPGRRITKLAGPLPGLAQHSFSAMVERRERTIYFAALKNGAADNFFGPVVAGMPLIQTLMAPGLDRSATEFASLEVALQGVTRVGHRVAVTLNGVALGTVSFAEQARGELVVPIHPATLRDGRNTVELTSEGAEPDVSLLDYIRLTYGRTYRADQGLLWFSLPGGKHARIDGFNSPYIRVVDVTDPREVKELSVMRQTFGPGSFAATVSAPQEGERTLLAFADIRVLKTIAVPNHPSTWHLEEQGAEVVILSHESFLESLAPLRALREAEGRSVALIDVQDLYDEYSFGMKTPWAIRQFLAEANTRWEQPPGFVLLVGDASFDSRNYLGLGDFDFLPTKLVETAVLETASDDWFADFDDDGLAEMALGRIPVRTAREAATLIAKIVGYSQAEVSGNWTREILLVNDHDEGFDFHETGEQLQAAIPPQFLLEEISLSFVDPASARMQLLGELNAGKLMVNYLGHGSVGVWTGSELLTASTARSLTNGLRLPFVAAMTCLNGFFHDLFTESLAEALLKAEQGGAVAVFASSGLTAPKGQAVMNAALLEHLFSNEPLTLGEAVVRAKAAVREKDVRRSWIFFGDPATTLK